MNGAITCYVKEDGTSKIYWTERVEKGDKTMFAGTYIYIVNVSPEATVTCVLH